MHPCIADKLTLKAVASRSALQAKGQDLKDRVPSIIRELERSSDDVVRLVEEDARNAERERLEWEARQQKWRREEQERKVAKALQDSKEELLQIIGAWAECRRLDEFFADAEQRLQCLPENELAIEEAEAGAGADRQY